MARIYDSRFIRAAKQKPPASRGELRASQASSQPLFSRRAIRTPRLARASANITITVIVIVIIIAAAATTTAAQLYLALALAK